MFQPWFTKCKRCSISIPDIKKGGILVYVLPKQARGKGKLYPQKSLQLALLFPTPPSSLSLSSLLFFLLSSLSFSLPPLSSSSLCVSISVSHLLPCCKQLSKQEHMKNCNPSPAAIEEPGPAGKQMSGLGAAPARGQLSDAPTSTDAWDRP